MIVSCRAIRCALAYATFKIACLKITDFGFTFPSRRLMCQSSDQKSCYAISLSKQKYVPEDNITGCNSLVLF